MFSIEFLGESEGAIIDNRSFKIIFIAHHFIKEKRTLNKKSAPKIERNFLGFAPGVPKEDIDNIVALQKEVLTTYLYRKY